MTPKRVFTKTEGYDCREGRCAHDSKGDHGIHCEEWHYVVTFGDYAVSLAVYTNRYPSTVNTAVFGDSDLGKIRGAYLGSHANFWVKSEEDAFRKGEYQQKTCEYVTNPGSCNGDGSYLLAKEFYAKHGRMDGNPEQSEAFWLALEALAGEWASEARANRLDAEWERCGCCDGRGIVLHKHLARKGS